MSQEQINESLRNFLPLYDFLERMAYLKAYVEDDQELLEELESGPSIPEMREVLEN